ncbi:type IV secretory system conjugative DNA transfer family protein [Peribacillus frigoritolerans]|uniref:VirD4-like conjugal transfer protein, CD1115 family n=1 Tax=Peribacillus frigoritolerans TaxID=450367 RepID=UPI0021D0518C|nr:type IV secretory system conjugative DNA transfer family protein [Peribacillus frigoritolerans]MCU6603823.1 type IV secretory system conjugative DNA transfer family protein [Peribacillus frigoritolerans]
MKHSKGQIIAALLLCSLITILLDYVAILLIGAGPVIFTQIKDIDDLLNFGQFNVLHNYILNPSYSLELAMNQKEIFPKVQYAALGVFVWLLFNQFKQAKKHVIEEASDYGAHGSSRWANTSEIFNKADITSDIEEEGQFIGMHGKKPIIQHEKSWLNRNVAIFGGSGSGKTHSYIINNILNTKTKSIVITDPKGEIYNLTSETKRKQGYDVRMVNFKDLTVSDRYNSMDYIKKQTDALKVAQTLIKNTTEDGKMKGDFWDKAEAALLSALILYVKYCTPKEQQHFGSVFKLLLSPYELIEMLFMELPDDHIAKVAYLQAISKLADKVRANVFISLSVTMDLWKYPEVCEFTETSDFKFEDIGQKKMIVYVILPIAEKTFRPLITCFFDQMFYELYDLADRNDNKLPVKVRMLWDEFNNIGKISSFTERQSTTRSYGIELTLIIQSMGQLKDRWGAEQADELIDNSDIILFLGTNSKSSTEYFSDLLGKTTVRVQSSSSSKNDNGSSQGENYSYIGRPLMTPDELKRFDKSMMVAFIKGYYPIKLTKGFYHQIKYYNDMLGEKTSIFDYPMESREPYNVFNPIPMWNEKMAKQKKKIKDFLVETNETKPDPDSNKILDELEI